MSNDRPPSLSGGGAAFYGQGTGGELTVEPASSGPSGSTGPGTIGPGSNMTVSGGGPTFFGEGPGAAVGRNVKAYGAVGDGTADDTAALNAAAAAASSGGDSTVYYPPGIYRTTGNLWWYGNTNHMAASGAVILLDAPLTAVASNIYWVVLGGPSMGAAAIPWSGVVFGLTFRVTANADGTNYVTMMWPTAVNGGTIDSCVFDATAKPNSKIGAIRASFNSAWVTGPSLTNLAYRNCTATAVQGTSGSEAYSAEAANGVTIESCVCSGFGDDAIAVHTCTNFTIANNRCSTHQGRILNDGSDKGTITGNLVQRIKTLNGTGVWVAGVALIEVILASAAGFPADTTITGNTLMLGLATTAESGFRVNGGRRITFTGNTIVNPVGGAVNYPAGWIHQAFAGWTDPEGLDAAGTMLVRDVRLADNNYVGAPFGSSGGGGTDSVNVRHDLPGVHVTANTVPGDQVNASAGNVFRYTLTGNWGLIGFFGAALDQEIEVSFIQDSVGGRTYQWPIGAKYAGGAPPAGSTAANYIDTIRFRYDGTNWNELSRAVGLH